MGNDYDGNRYYTGTSGRGPPASGDLDALNAIEFVAKLKFTCRCGKSLSADATAAGKKAKCPNCGQVVQIPPAAIKKPESQPAPATKSIWDEVDESGAAAASAATCPICGEAMATATVCSACGYDSESKLQPIRKSSAAAKPRAGLFAKLANRPWWLNWVAFLAYVGVVWLVSRASPIGSLVLVMPVFFLAVLIFLFGGLWYFLVLMRDDPGQATSLFFALLLSFIFGGGASAAGYQTGRRNRGKPANPSHTRPIALMKFGALGMAFSLGATLIVGILLGTWTKEGMRRARFRELENRRPPMHRFER